MRAIRTDRYKYVRNFWHLPAVYLTTDIYASASGRAVRTEYLANQREYEELYDLSVDPHERNDVSDAGDYAAVRDRLRGELQEWMRKTDDPLLSGPVLPADYDEIEFPE